MIIETIPQLAQLSRSEKIELALELMDETAANAGPDNFPLTPEQEQELARRLQHARANPGGGIPVEEVMARLMAKYETAQQTA